ncbi:hypothetical protein BGZ82_002189, partial [Podila clonocystis]
SDLFFPSDDDEEVSLLVYRAHVSAAIVQALPEGTPVVAIEIVPIDKLNVNKTDLFPMQTLQLDESTISGNVAVVERVVLFGIDVPLSWIENPEDIIFAGNQMMVLRLLTVKIHRMVEKHVFNSFSWVHPTLQLFHLSMNLCGSIFRTHYGSPEVPGSLAAIGVLLGRKRLGKDKQEFKDADELLRIVFNAKVQLLYRTLQQNDVVDELDIQRNSETIASSFCGLPTPLILGLPSTTSNTNALLFLHDVVVHIELIEAVKAGDIGRIKHFIYET